MYAVASYTADQFPDHHPTVEAVGAYVGYVEDYLDGYDLTTGQPLTDTKGTTAPDSTS